MSGDAERTMKNELEAALGESVSHEEARQALDREAPSLAHWAREQQLLIVIGGATALVVGVMFSMWTGVWAFAVVALAVHAVATLVVGYVVLRITADVEKPHPLTVARLQDEGVDDPEARLNLAIQAHEDGHGDRVRREFGVDADERSSHAARDQAAITPSSEETEPVGPGEGSRNGKG